MVIKGFISFQNAWVKSSEDKCITFPLLTSDLELGSPVPMSMGGLRERVGNNFGNCTDLNKKFLEKKIIKATVLTWQLKVYSFILSDTLAIESY